MAEPPPEVRDRRADVLGPSGVGVLPGEPGENPVEFLLRRPKRDAVLQVERAE